MPTQANPLNHKQPDIHLMGGSRGMLAAKQPLVVPMLLRLSQFRLNSYVVLVVHKQKGITLVFKTDPLQNVDIHSTFDSIAVIQKFIQREIEGQLRQMFREDLPGIIHRLSQQWFRTKVEAPYLDPSSRVRAPPPTPVSPSVAGPSQPSSSQGFEPRPASSSHSSLLAPLTLSPTKPSRKTSETLNSPKSPSSASTDPFTPFPDIEHYDPTYGLRPEGTSQKEKFSGFGQLFSKSRGLADLTEEPLDDADTPDPDDFGSSNWDSNASDVGPSSRATSPDGSPEYETVMAVGGGLVNRPRVIHSQSQSLLTPHSPLSTGFGSPFAHFARGQSLQSLPFSRPTLAGLRASSVASNPYFPRMPMDASFMSPRSPSSSTGGSSVSQGITHRRRSKMAEPPISEPVMLPTPPSSDVPAADSTVRNRTTRRPSLSALTMDEFGFPDPHRIHESEAAPSRIVVRPALSGTVSKLSVLSHSNHTLSPFARPMEHFIVRSGPPRTPHPVVMPDRLPQKAKRKRMHRLGKKRPLVVRPTTPVSDEGSDDMDRYFRYHEDER
jgi:distribution and morphology protein 34